MSLPSCTVLRVYERKVSQDEYHASAPPANVFRRVRTSSAQIDIDGLRGVDHNTSLYNNSLHLSTLIRSTA